MAQEETVADNNAHKYYGLTEVKQTYERQVEGVTVVSKISFYIPTNLITVTITNDDVVDDWDWWNNEDGNWTIEDDGEVVQENPTIKQKIEAEKKIVEAEATKKANELLEKSLTDKILTEEFIKKWNGQLPSTYAGNDVFKMFGLN